MLIVLVVIEAVVIALISMHAFELLKRARQEASELRKLIFDLIEAAKRTSALEVEARLAFKKLAKTRKKQVKNLKAENEELKEMFDVDQDQEIEDPEPEEEEEHRPRPIKPRPKAEGAAGVAIALMHRMRRAKAILEDAQGNGSQINIGALNSILDTSLDKIIPEDGEE